MKCKTCGAPAKHMPPDGDFRYDPPRSTLPREGQGEAQVFTYEHSAMGGGMYATTISNDPPPPNLWCRIKKFSPATLSPSPAVRDGVVEADKILSRIVRNRDRCDGYGINRRLLEAQAETAEEIVNALRALSTQEQGNG